MGVRLVNEDVPKSIWAGDMEDGDIAVIVGWTYPACIGRIIQRHKNNFISIGCYSGCSWNHGYKESVCLLSRDCRVRVLEKGETLVIT